MVDATQRSGILTQVGLLAGFRSSAQRRPGAARRLRDERLLCAAPPAPPPNVNTALPELKADAKLTTRQQLEQSHVAAACAACHKSIDGIGFRLRELRRGRSFPHQRARLTGRLHRRADRKRRRRRVSRRGRLRKKLAGSAQVRECVSTQWLRYALGVTREEIEGCMVAPIVKAFADSGSTCASFWWPLPRATPSDTARSSERGTMMSSSRFSRRTLMKTLGMTGAATFLPWLRPRSAEAADSHAPPLVLGRKRHSPSLVHVPIGRRRRSHRDRLRISGGAIAAQRHQAEAHRLRKRRHGIGNRRSHDPQQRALRR